MDGREIRIPGLEHIFREMEESAQAGERKRILADPKGHKTTRLMAGHLRYRYWSPKHKLPTGESVKFCYSTGRNLAGYFLAWREIWDAEKGEGRRENWVADKKRKMAREHARRACEIHDERMQRKQTRENTGIGCPLPKQ
jgi:hypothetical protein